MVDNPEKSLLHRRPDEEGTRSGLERLSLQRRIWIFLTRDEDYHGPNERTIEIELDLFNRQAQWVLGLHAGPVLGRDDDERVMLHVALPLLGQVFLSFRGPPVPAMKEGHEFEARFSFVDPTLVASLTAHGDGSGGWRRDDPWWKRGVQLDLVELVFGRQETFTKKRSLGWVDVPMLEGTYKAKVYRVTYTHVRPRWPFLTRHALYDFRRFKGPNGGKSIPFPGKGDNSWDCGMDGLFGISVPIRGSLQDAVGYVVGKVLETRVERAGEASWTPPAKKTKKKLRRTHTTLGDTRYNADGSHEKVLERLAEDLKDVTADPTDPVKDIVERIRFPMDESKIDPETPNDSQ